MTSWTKRIAMGAVAAGVIGVWLPACADNESSIFIRQVLAPAGDSCSYTADPGGAAYMEGTLDLAFRREYRAGLLVGSQLVQRGAGEKLRTETSRFRVEGTEIRIETTDGAVVKEYTVPTSGFVDPASGTTPGWGVVGSVLIDSDTGASLSGSFVAGERSPTIGRVVSVVKVFGTTLGGQEIQSGEFRFPISVCYGCLVSFPPEAADPAQPLPNCKGTAASSTSACFLGQDDAVDCRVCANAGFPAALCQP